MWPTLLNDIGNAFFSATISHISLSETWSCEGATVFDKWSCKGDTDDLWSCKGAIALLEWFCKEAFLMIGFGFC